MKVGIATTLSIAGVLAAGASAYAVNSSVLKTSSSITATAADPSGTLVVGAVTTLPGQVAEQSTRVQSSVLSNNTTTYQVGTSGSVVIETISGAIVVSNVLPATGWTSEPAQGQPNGDVKVPFVSSSTRIEFLAHLANGKVTVSVTSQPIAPLSTMKPATNSTNPSVPFLGDDHDDEDDDDDHSDDEDDD